MILGLLRRAASISVFHFKTTIYRVMAFLPFQQYADDGNRLKTMRVVFDASEGTGRGIIQKFSSLFWWEKVCIIQQSKSKVAPIRPIERHGLRDAQL